jgi:hypothetical protein
MHWEVWGKLYLEHEKNESYVVDTDMDGNQMVLADKLERAALLGRSLPISFDMIEFPDRQPVFALLWDRGERRDLAYLTTEGEMLVWWKPESWWSLELPDGFIDLGQSRQLFDLRQLIDSFANSSS